MSIKNAEKEAIGQNKSMYTEKEQQLCLVDSLMALKIAYMKKQIELKKQQ